MRYDTKINCFVFEAGEKVKIKSREYLAHLQLYGDRANVGVNDFMLSCADKVFTIERRSRSPYPTYSLVEVGWTWTEEMFVSSHKVSIPRPRIPERLLEGVAIIETIKSDGCVMLSDNFNKIVWLVKHGYLTKQKLDKLYLGLDFAERTLLFLFAEYIGNEDIKRTTSLEIRALRDHTFDDYFVKYKMEYDK